LNPLGHAQIVLVDPDGRLGTVPVSAVGNPDKSPGVQPQAVPDAAGQAKLDLKVQDLRATVTQQQQQIETLTAQLKENAAQIQKANAQLEMNKPASKVVVNEPNALP
jgi:Tfp pilus assembly protein FimV